MNILKLALEFCVKSLYRSVIWENECQASDFSKKCCRKHPRVCIQDYLFNCMEKQICSGSSLHVQKRKSNWFWCLVLNVFRLRRLLNSPFGVFHILLISLTGTSVILSLNTSFQRPVSSNSFAQDVCENFCSSNVFGIGTNCCVDKTLTWASPPQKKNCVSTTVCYEGLNHVVIYSATRQQTNDVSCCVKTSFLLFVRTRSSRFRYFFLSVFYCTDQINC